MNKASSAFEGSQGKIFLRNATGLLREVSLLDAFIMNTFGMNIAVGAVFLFLQASAFFPQGNMLVAVIIGTLLMALRCCGSIQPSRLLCPAPGVITYSSAA